MNDINRHSPLNPLALSIESVGGVLSRLSNSTVTLEMLRGDIAAGAPTNVDGTINLVHYAAWLLKEMQRGE
jgi:hypothetical protein